MKRLMHYAVPELFGFRKVYFADGDGQGGGGQGGGQGAGDAGGGDGTGGSGQGAAGSQGQAGAGAGSSAQGAGGGASDWKTELPVEVRDHACFKDFKNRDELAIAYANQQKLIGVDKLPIPPKDAKPEVRAKFMEEVFSRLGRPKDATGYQFTDPKLPDGISIPKDEATISGFKDVSHKLGLLPDQADGIYKFYMEHIAGAIRQQNEAAKKTVAEATAELRRDFGAAFDAKVKAAEGVLNKFATDEERAYLVEKGLNNDPRAIRFLVKIGEAMGEDTITSGVTEGVMTPTEARKERQAIFSNKQHPYWVKGHPEHLEAVRRVNDLLKMETAGQ